MVYATAKRITRTGNGLYVHLSAEERATLGVTQAGDFCDCILNQKAGTMTLRRRRDAQ